MNAFESASVQPGANDLGMLTRAYSCGDIVPASFQVASVAAPEPKLLTVQPWDKSLLKAVEKKDKAKAQEVLKKLDASCKTCHMSHK